MLVCKNCGRVFEGNYCNNCGQSAKTKRLNWHFIIHNFEQEVLHFDHGIVFTIWEIFVRPGKAVHEFLGGKRKKYSHPLTYIAVISVIYFILRSIFVKYESPENASNSDKIIVDFIYHYYPKIVIVIFIPLAALFTPIFYPDKPYNFVELFTFHCYVRGQFMLFEILVLFITWLLTQFNITVYPLLPVLVTTFFNLFFMGWALKQFFHEKDFLLPLLKSIGLTIFLIICAALMAIAAGNILGKK